MPNTAVLVCCAAWLCQHTGGLASPHAATSGAEPGAEPQGGQEGASSLGLLRASGASQAAELRRAGPVLLAGRQRSRRGAGLRRGLRAAGDEVESAKATLNVMVQDAMRKLDLEQVKCSEYETKQLVMMEEMRRDIGRHGAQAAAARSKTLGAEAAIDKLQKAESEVRDSLRMHNEKCSVDVETVRGQRRIASEDAELLEKVSAGMDCAGGAAMALVQCRDGRGRSSFAVAKRRPALLGPRGAAAGRRQRRRCSVRAEASCGIMRARLLRMQAAALDRLDELGEELVRLQERCGGTADGYNAQLADAEARYRDAQAALAEAVKLQAENEEQSRLKSLQLQDLTKDYGETLSTCKANLQHSEAEICNIRKLRAELYSAAGVRPFVQDCEVSKWTPDECPVTCGGGVQRLTRQVLSLASFGGAACPPLQMLRRCSEQRCPVDCQLAEWSSWSSCTARCSGGVRQRSRAVVVEASHGGRSCGASTEAEGCNLQACDSDCRLADWGDWSACSKMCNDGLQQRHRMVEVSAVGSGLCPDAEAPARLEYRPCNAQACALAPGRPTLQCASRLDVVLLLDGSASVQEAGWSAMLAAAGALAGALAGETGTRLGLLVFSGPSSFRALLRCTRGPQEGEPPPELELECGVRWVSHLTADVASVAEQIPRLAWPGGSALTSVALTTARSELRVARRDARSVVIVMTHARPMSPRMTGQAAAMVRESARLLWVPVAKYPPLTELSQWSSRPVRENVIHVPDFETLRKPTTVSSLIADLCPQVI